MAADPRWVPSPAFLKAFEAACLAHGNDARKINREPYIGHLMGVASLVIEHNGTQEQAIAALLHDIIEDSPMTFDELEFQFGPGVRKIVQACTDATHAEKVREKALNKLSDEDKKDPQKVVAAKKLYNEKWWERKKAYLDRLEKKDHTDPSVLVALADKVNNGEKSALDLSKLSHEEVVTFWDTNFNVGYKRQRDWYQGLAAAFTKVSQTTVLDEKGNEVAMHELQQRLVRRFTNAVSAMFK